jgi:hypothetical protein
VLGGKPSFTDVHLLGDTVQVGGKSDDAETPHQVHVTLLQEVDGQKEPHAVETTLALPASDWEANFPSDGFKKGSAVVIGHEISLEPHFSAHTWVEYVIIQ